MATYVNPLDRLADYRSKIGSSLPQGDASLQDTSWRDAMQQGVKLPAIKSANQVGLSPVTMQIQSGTQSIRDAASRQHQLKLSAIKNSLAAQQGSVGSSAGVAIGGKYSGKGFVGPYKLVAGAANSLAAMMADYKKQTGKTMPIASGGRTYEEQARLYALYKAGKGNLAAPPGKSEHNKGRAVDFGTKVFNWLQKNAASFGWKWTGKNFSQVEPWHWEWFG